MITGSLIKKMREEAGLTQEELAKATDISQAHVAKIENEKVNPRLSTVNKILSVLQMNKNNLCKYFITKNLISVKPEDSVNYAVKLMRENDISQLPVIDGDKCVGSISERTIVKNLGGISGSTEIRELMEEPFPMISCKDGVEVAKTLLDYHQAVLVLDRGKIIGIITKSDLLNLLK
ncbi:MAG: CBS domain-containing protein [Candidatus Aenigmarchaeota archaeon]|nr:CBS domain-containing protein [Candidatus Aenigmarchaeota archaeon]